MKLRTWEGRADDQFIQLTEGMVAEETLEDPVDSTDFTVEPLGPHHRVITAAPRGHRLGLVLKGHPEQRFIGLGARHGTAVDQAGRHLQLGAAVMTRWCGPRRSTVKSVESTGSSSVSSATMPSVSWMNWSSARPSHVRSFTRRSFEALARLRTDVHRTITQ